MDLDGRVYFKIFRISYSDVNYEEYRRIIDAICLLIKRYDYKISEM